MEEDARNSNGARESSHYRQYSLPLLRHPDRHQGRLSSMRTQVNDKKKSRNKTISAPFLIFVRYMRSLLRNWVISLFVLYHLAGNNCYSREFFEPICTIKNHYHMKKIGNRLRFGGIYIERERRAIVVVDCIALRIRIQKLWITSQMVHVTHSCNYFQRQPSGYDAFADSGPNKCNLWGEYDRSKVNDINDSYQEKRDERDYSYREFIS